MLCISFDTTSSDLPKIKAVRDALMEYAGVTEDTAEAILSHDEESLEMYLFHKKYNVYWAWTTLEEMVRYLYLANIVGVDSFHRTYIDAHKIDPRTVNYSPAYALVNVIGEYQSSYTDQFGNFISPVPHEFTTYPERAELYAVRGHAEATAAYRKLEVVEVDSINTPHRGLFAVKS